MRAPGTHVCAPGACLSTIFAHARLHAHMLHCMPGAYFLAFWTLELDPGLKSAGQLLILTAFGTSGWLILPICETSGWPMLLMITVASAFNPSGPYNGGSIRPPLPM